MFLQLEHNTPEIYPEESRDFQLLCRILNIFLNALIEKSSKLPYDTSIDTLDEDLLFVMARRLGFTTHKYFPAIILKNICENFPYLIKHKGTKDAIQKAAYTVLSANQDVVYLDVEVDTNNLKINILSNASAMDLEYLDELLTFVVPAGMLWEYVPSIREEITYRGAVENLSGGGRTGRSRLRGVGESVSRIVKDSNWTLKDPSRETITTGDYYAGEEPEVPTRNWTSAAIPNTPVGTPEQPFTKFYSKTNIARIVKKTPESNGVILEYMNNEYGNPIQINSQEPGGN